MRKWFQRSDAGHGERELAVRVPALSALTWLGLPEFVPHGYCYLWNPWIVWLHVISDSLITLSYFCIPVALIYFARQRSHLPFQWIFWMFGCFIMGCGTTHLMEVWTIWHPEYLLSGVIKAFTAIISVATAIVLVPLVPRALALPSPAQLSALNTQLQEEIGERKQTEQALKKSLAETQRANEESVTQKLLIAERRYVEDVLQESQSRLQGIIDSAMDAIITIDEQQNIVLFNAAAERMFKCSAMQAIGTTVEKFLPPRFRASHKQHVRNFGDLGVTNRAMGALGPLWAMRTNGQEFPIEASISQVESAGKKLFTVIIRDISERRLIEERLRDQAEILDMAQVLVRELDGRILLWTAGAERMYGFSRGEALGAVAHHLLKTKFPLPLVQIEAQLKTIGIWEGELVHRKKDGSEIVVVALKVLQRDEMGRPARILEAVTDITARKRAEQSAWEAQARLTGIIESAMDAIVAVDGDQRVVLFNAAAEKMFCISAQEAMGQSVERFVPERFRKSHGMHTLRFGETRAAGSGIGTLGATWGLRATGEEFPLEAAISQLDAGGTKLFTVILRDITERKRAEEQVQRLNEDLERRVEQRTAQLQTANRELEAFTYSVSHDLRAPLRHINGFGELLMEEAGATLTPEAQRYLGRIQEGSQRMGILVDELLSLARVGRQALRIQPTNLNVLVQETVNLLQPEYVERQIDWKISELSTMECDPVLVRQVFQNLISNAIKYSRPRQRAVIEVGQIASEQETVIFVRDSGVGFNMKYANKLFGVFQRLHRAEEFEGTGIGLATVQRIVQKHGGRIWAESEVDRGATFYFTLGGPVTEQAPEKPRQAMGAFS